MRFSALSRALLRCVFASLLVPASILLGAGTYDGPVWSLVDRPAVVRAAASITTETHPDCDIVTVDAKLTRSYHADGTAEQQDEIFTKVLTEAGRRANATWSVHFTRPYSVASVPSLELLKPSGEIVSVDVAANSGESTANGQMKANIYNPDDRVLTVSIPRLEIGDVVHAVIRVTTEKPIIPGEFADLESFETHGAIHHLSYEVHGPVAKPLRHILLRDPVPGTVTTVPVQPEDNGNQVYRWEVNRVPRIFDEPSMHEVSQRLMVSTIADWETVSRWYWSLCEPRLAAVSPELRQAVKELTAPAKTDDERMRVLFQCVSNTIRYMGISPENDRPGFEPHDVSLTWTRKYGVCRDKATLLVAMLRLAGFKAHPAIIATDIKRDPEWPTYWFNHAVVVVERPGQPFVLLDPTLENTRELFPANLGNRSYLVCRPEGDTLRVSPIEPAEANQVLVTTSGKLDQDGTLVAHSRIEFTGIIDHAIRETLIQLRPDERLRFFEQLQTVLPGAVLKSTRLVPENLLDTSTNIQVDLDYTQRSAVVAGDGRAILSVPWLRIAPSVLDDAFGAASTEKRKYPFEFAAAARLLEEITIELSDAYLQPLSLPEGKPIDFSWLCYAQTYRYADHVLHISKEAALKAVELPASAYPELRQAVMAAEEYGRKVPIFALKPSVRPAPPVAVPPPAPPPVQSDLHVFEHRDEFVVKNEREMTHRFMYRVQVLTDSGKEKIPELRVGYNPATGTARIVRAVVTSPSGRQQQLSPEEITVMDADWNATAKRYSGGKLVIAHLPGIEVGSIIEAEYEQTWTCLPYIGGFSAFQEGNPIDRKSYRMTLPAGLRVQSLVTGPDHRIQQTTTTAKGRKTVEWEAKAIPALHQEDATPAGWSYLPGLLTFIGDADAYFREMHTTMLARASHATNARTLAHQLTKQAKSPREAVTVLRDFVARNIRLAGPAFTELPLKQLSDADTTLADGYGHHADRAILLFAMLRAIDVPAEFVIASSVKDLPKVADVVRTFPTPHVFTFPLVRAELDLVPTILPIDEYQALGMTHFEGNLAMRLSDRKIIPLRLTEELRDRTDRDVTLALSDTGSARLTFTERYFGVTHGEKKQYFAELTREERRRHVEGLVRDVAQDAVLVGEFVTDFDQYPGKTSFTVDVPTFGTTDGRFMYFELPWIPAVYTLSAQTRSLPLRIDRCEITSRIEIQLPPGFPRVSLAPSAKTLHAAGNAEVRIDVERTENRFILTHRVNVPEAVVQPDEYQSLKDLKARQAHRSSRLILLEPAPKK